MCEPDALHESALRRSSDTAGHPERVERMRGHAGGRAEFRERGGDVVSSRGSRPTQELARIHDADYITLIRETAGRATALDPDTFTSPDTYDVALLAAGAAVTASTTCSTASRHACARAGAAARPSRRAEPGDGLLSVQQHRRLLPRMPAPAASRASPSSTTTCITATARSGAFTTIRRCCSSRRISIRTIRAPARPTRSAAGAGNGFTVNLPLAAGATDADYERVYDDGRAVRS